MTSFSNNRRRAMRIAHILTWCKDWASPPEGLIDLLTDARHWCDQNGESFGDLDRQAYRHHLAEFNEEARLVKATVVPIDPDDEPDHALQQLGSLASKALEAFWQAVVDHYPRAETGDLSPLATLRLDEAAEAAIAEWIDNNVSPTTTTGV
jgi:hypothetical protein